MNGRKIGVIRAAVAGGAIAVLAGCSSGSGGPNPKSHISVEVGMTTTTILPGANSTVGNNGPATSYPVNPAPVSGNDSTPSAP